VGERDTLDSRSGLDGVGRRTQQLDALWTIFRGRRMHARVATRPARPLVPGVPPLVFVHGLSVSSRYMLPAARHLAPFCRVYVPDLPGFGYSAKPPRVLDLPGLADTLAEWMRGVGLERAVLLGNSLGCQTIANFARRHPEMIAGAIFIGPTMDPWASAFDEFFRLAYDLLLIEPISFFFVILLEFLQTGPWWAQRTFHYALNDDVVGKYAQMRVPTLVLRGERDPICPPGWADQLLHLLPEARPLVTIPGAAHCLNYNAPSALARIVVPFLREMSQRPSPPIPPTVAAKTPAAPIARKDSRPHR
jgi:2-hydroxy-6-oxonona-2,4-dienedioate hydrolase